MLLLISKSTCISMNLFIILPYSLGLSPLLHLSFTLCPTLPPISSAFPDPLLLASPPSPAPKLVLKFFFVSCPVTCGAVGPKLHLKIIFIVILSRHLQGPQFVFCPPLWETDWQLVTGRALVLGTHRKPCRRCPEPRWRKCGQASTRWGTRCRPIMFHWNPNKAPDSGSFPWDSPVRNWSPSRISQQLVSPW